MLSLSGGCPPEVITTASHLEVRVDFLDPQIQLKLTFLSVCVWHLQHCERIRLQMMLLWHPWASLKLFRSVMFIGHLCRFLALYSFVGISGMFKGASIQDA